MAQKYLFMSSENVPILRMNGGFDRKKKLIGRIDINGTTFSGILGSENRNREAYFLGVPERNEDQQISKLLGFLVRKEHAHGGIVVHSALEFNLAQNFPKRQIYSGKIFQTDPRECRLLNLKDYFMQSGRAKLMIPKKNKKEQFAEDFMDAYKQIVYMTNDHQPIGTLDMYMAKSRDLLFVDL